MDPTTISPGDEGVNEQGCLEHWRNIMNNNVHNDNTLWIWAGQMAHNWMFWRQEGLMDSILHHLFAIGLFNWKGEDVYLHQTTPAM